MEIILALKSLSLAYQLIAGFGALLSILLLAFLGLVIFAHLPLKAIELLELSNVPDEIKAAGKKQFWLASFRSYLSLPFDLSAPLVVPFLLLFTKTTDDKLKFGDSIWGNDISINGDVRHDDGTLVQVSNDLSNGTDISICYWAKGHHPRSFYARWVWLGLRNRASALSQSFGAEVVLGIGAAANPQQWVSGPDVYDGWNLRKVEGQTTYIIKSVNGLDGKPVVSIFAYIPSFFGKYRRIYFGFKIPLMIPEWKKAQLASVGWSLR